MSKIQDTVVARFAELANQAKQIPLQGRDSRYASAEQFYAWATSSLDAIRGVFGADSPHYKRFESEMLSIPNNYVTERQFEAFKGMFAGAKSDVDSGHLFHIQASFTGEIFGDFVATAKAALAEGQHTVALVLACAALEASVARMECNEIRDDIPGFRYAASRLQFLHYSINHRRRHERFTQMPPMQFGIHLRRRQQLCLSRVCA